MSQDMDMPSHTRVMQTSGKQGVKKGFDRHGAAANLYEWSGLSAFTRQVLEGPV